MSKAEAKPTTIEFGPVNDLHGYKNVRWVENVSRGLRLVGFADEVARSIDHKGWFTEDDGDNGEVMRGIVYALPGRHGLPQYVYGYADPCNDDCALLCFDNPKLTKMEAAIAADRFAEICAEHARDYNRAWQAGARFNDLGDDIASLRREALALGAEMRGARKANLYTPRICAALRGEIASIYRRIQKARKERAELLDNFGSCEGFKEV